MTDQNNDLKDVVNNELNKTAQPEQTGVQNVPAQQDIPAPTTNTSPAPVEELKVEPSEPAQTMQQNVPAGDIIPPKDPRKEDQSLPKAVNPLPFDVSQLDTGQLQALKSALNATPAGLDTKNQNPTLKLRLIEGKIVMNHKPAYNTMQFNEIAQRKIEVHMIPVLLKDEAEYKDIPYKEFINAETITAEILEKLTKKENEEMGETISEETKELVTMYINNSFDYFTLKLPNGDIIEKFDSRLI